MDIDDLDNSLNIFEKLSNSDEFLQHLEFEPERYA